MRANASEKSTAATSSEVAIDQTDVAYLEADNFADLMTLAGDNLVSAGDVFGDGYAMIDQEKLVGVEFIVNGYKEILGDFGAYSSVTAMLRVPVAVEGSLVSKVRFNDGGTGILAALSGSPRDAAGNFKPVHCKHGLKRSDYMKDLPDPKTGELKPTPATTYYFDTSA